MTVNFSKMLPFTCRGLGLVVFHWSEELSSQTVALSSLKKLEKTHLFQLLTCIHVPTFSCVIVAFLACVAVNLSFLCNID